MITYSLANDNVIICQRIRIHFLRYQALHPSKGSKPSNNNESLLLNCRAKKMYEAFSISHEQSQACLNFAMARKSMKIVNKQVKFLTTQYIGTCKSAYTKGYALN